MLWSLVVRLVVFTWRFLFGPRRSKVYGEARWMAREERGRFLSRRNKGLAFGPRSRLSLRESFNHVAVVAPTGAGKTSRYVIPNILAAEGSVVVTDPAGELFERTSGQMQDRGYRVQVLRPAEPSRSLRFNPLSGLREAQGLKQLATILSQNATGKGSEPFWGLNARNILQIGLSALVNVEDQRHVNLGNLRWVLNHLGDRKAMDYFMSRYLTGDQLFAEYLAFCAQDPKVIASTLSTARACLDLWSDPEVCRLTAAHSVDIEGLRREKTIIYIIVPEHRVRYFGVLINLVYHTCFVRCLESVDADSLPVFFFLDEFGNLGYIPEFASVITTLRKRGCSISIILQELSQLQAVYGREEAATIFGGGCANKLFFAGLDLQTTRYIEDTLGRTTEYDTPLSGREEQARTVGVPLMSSDEVRMLRRSEAILISGRRRPVKLRLLPYFKNAELLRCTNKPPAEPELDYSGETVAYLDLTGNYRLQI